MMKEMLNNIERDQRKREATANNFINEVKESLNSVKDGFKNNPSGMDYFYNKYEDLYINRSEIYKDKKVVATMCVHVPDELILAVDALPLKICSGSYSFERVGADFVPAKSCSLIKSTIGNIHLNDFPGGADPLMIVNPTTCDQKTKINNIEADDDTRFYPLEVPPSKDSEEAKLYWYRVVNKFKSELEKKSGKKITKKKLKKAINITNQARYQFRRLNSIRQEKSVIYGKDVLMVANAYFFDDPENWTLELSKLNDELDIRVKENNVVTDESTPRILLIGSPSIFPNLKVPLLVEELGGIVVADEFCSSTRLLYDPIAVDEWHMYDMIPAIADSYLKPNTCPHFVKNDDFDRKIFDTIKKYSIDGVVFQSYSGCQLFELESLRVSKLMEKNSVPMLYLETYYNPDDKNQLVLRIEAFLDSLKARKN